MSEIDEEMRASYAADLKMMQTALAQMTQISAAVYALEGRGVEGANMKAAAIGVIDRTRNAIRGRLDGPIKVLSGLLIVDEDEGEDGADDEDMLSPADQVGEEAGDQA